MLWLLTGLTIGTLNGLTLRWTVNRLRPGAALSSVLMIAIGFSIRLGLAAGLLIIALQRSITPALLAFAGLLLARWITAYATLPHRSPAKLLRK